MTAGPQTFRKKPIEIEAVRFTGNESAEAILKWAGTPPILADIDPATGIATALLVDTLEGTMRAELGDWIIREPFPTDDRKFYPCKPGIFAATYETVRSSKRPGEGE